MKRRGTNTGNREGTQYTVGTWTESTAGMVSYLGARVARGQIYAMQQKYMPHVCICIFHADVEYEIFRNPTIPASR